MRLEGSVVTTCDECARYGTVVEEIFAKKRKIAVPEKAGVVLKRKKLTPEDYDIKFDEELVEDYAQKIKNAREHAGLKQEELAKMINEPVSLIHRIESNRCEPQIDVAKKIEKKLEIKLVKKSEEVGDMGMTAQKRGELTLGDLVVVRKQKND